MNKILRSLFLAMLLQITFIPVAPAYAATTPSLGLADSFTILSSTYTNTVGGTTITGDLGYTTGPATAPTVNGTIYSPPSSKYSGAGTDQGVALAALNAQACTHTFPAGAVDLATDTSHGPIGVYTPGVYCTTASSAASIGAGGITLSGSGTYIFRIDGALTTVSNSVVTLAESASACDVFWTPTGATTLGANSTFSGTNIDDAGITIGSTVTWVGRALAFGGTVSTDVDTISVPSCTTVSSSSSVSSVSTNSEAPYSYCPPVSSEVNTPIILSSRRVDADSIFLSWGPYSGPGLDTFIVQYGTTKGEWLYNTNITGFSTTINDLPANTLIWVRIAARNNCAIGTWGEPRLIGGPKLPDTGFAQKKSSLPWLTALGLLFLSPFLLKRLQSE